MSWGTTFRLSSNADGVGHLERPTPPLLATHPGMYVVDYMD